MKVSRNITTDFYESIELDITNECNLKCPLCHRNATGSEKFTLHTQEKQEMSLDTIKIINSKFPNLKTWYLGFLISEPFLHSDIINIIGYLKEQNKHIVISTNGNAHVPKKDNDNWAFWYTLRNILTEDDKIIWSVDGLTQQTYKKYRRGGKLKDVLATASIAISYMPRVHHEIQTIEFQHNEKELEEEYANISFLLDYQADNPNVTYNRIACCGDCSLNDDTVKPIWNLDKFKEIRNSVFEKSQQKILNGKVDCESTDNKILFVDHVGRIGFCPTHLTRTVHQQIKNGQEPVNVKDHTTVIEQFIKSEQMQRESNPICQFNCGKATKILKDIHKLGHVKTQ